jgi:membrane protease YdiL (CAAX protease family)
VGQLHEVARLAASCTLAATRGCLTPNGSLMQTLTAWARRRPLAAALVPVLAALYLTVGAARLLGHSIPKPAVRPVLAVLAFVLLFGTAVAVTRLVDGAVGVRRLLSRVFAWRIGLPWALVVFVALPVVSVLVAGASGTLRNPSGGWLWEVLSYLIGGVALSAVTTNLWEETLWSGFVQTRLMERHGLWRAALLTSVPFVLVHVPGAFQNVAASEGLAQIIALVILAPMLRYLAGVLLLETGGSILAVGLLHASFNASGQLSSTRGDWQFIPALVLLTAAVAVTRKVRTRVDAPVG